MQNKSSTFLPTLRGVLHVPISAQMRAGFLGIIWLGVAMLGEARPGAASPGVAWILFYKE